MNMTRRNFLKMVGAVGGSAAVYETMVALDMLRVPVKAASPLKLPAHIGNGKSVVILGAGVAGLCAAYELGKLGYMCTVIEAQDRVGGRSYTLRRGDVIKQEGLDDQVCDFDDNLYLNGGPGRIPYHHDTLIGYCKELGVSLEVYVMENRAAFFVGKEFDEKPVVNRQIATDTRGYISELLAKAILPGDLDLNMTREDETKLLDLLKVFGSLNDAFDYTGSSRAGYIEPPGAGERPGKISPPLPFENLLEANYWREHFYQPDDYLWQPTMFQPVGGMDKIVHAFYDAFVAGGGKVMTNAPVVSIMNTDDGVDIVYQDGEETTKISADYCISTIPLPILADIDNNFSSDFQTAIGSRQFDPTCKVGWQADKRFWEYQADPKLGNQIYGGITWTDMKITQIWYPSYDYFTHNGTLTGCYNFGDDAIMIGKMGLQQRLDFAFDQAVKIHPEFETYVPKKKGVSIAWQKVPYQHGGWLRSWRSGDGQEYYKRLLEPDGNVYLCGDQLSYLSGWQEGAVLSAKDVIEAVGNRS